VFCASCGTRRSEPVSAGPAQRFCVGCGSPLTTSSSFCTKCGVRVGSADAAWPAQLATPSSQSLHSPSIQTPAVQTIAPAQPVAKKSRGLAFKLFIAVAVLFVLAMLAFGAGLAYLGYVAKKRVAGLQVLTGPHGPPMQKQVVKSLSERLSARAFASL
jgi:hypothetical protein